MALDLYATIPYYPSDPYIGYNYCNEPPRRENYLRDSSTSSIGFGKHFIPNLDDATQPWEENTKFVIFLNDGPSLIQFVSEKSQSLGQKKNNVETNAITFVDRLNPIKERLALSITQLAELFGVTRKSIYDWYEGIEPRPNTMTRLEILTEALRSTSADIDLKRLKVVWNIPVSGESFRAVYNNNKLDDATLLAQLKAKLHELSPNLAKKTSTLRKQTAKIGEAHLVELDKHADFS